MAKTDTYTVKKYFCLCAIFVLVTRVLAAQTTDVAFNEEFEVEKPNVLKLNRGDVRLFPNEDKSFELFIRYVPGRESILITDTTVEPNHEEHNYTLRAYDWHYTYGNEVRILDGKILRHDPPMYFLMSNTTAPVAGFEDGSRWFHIHLPQSVMYGYPWSREGQFDIGSGTWINIRTFAKPFADYTGAYLDNPFTITSKKHSSPVADREKPFKDLTRGGNGLFYQPGSNEQMMEDIQEILNYYTGQDVDVAIVLDTTLSMKEPLKTLKATLVKKVKAFMEKPENQGHTQRIGMVFYRDYPPDEYLTKETDFTRNFKYFQTILQREVALGGYDIPEAVHEGIDAAIHKLSWQEDSKRVIIQIGDAIPHPKPRGTVTAQSVIADAQKNNIALHCILLPSKK